MSKLKKIASKRLNTTKRVKIQRKGAIKLSNKRLLKNKNKGKCYIPKNQLITETEKLINKELKELEDLRNKEIRECSCKGKCDCFVNLKISLCCFKEPLFIKNSLNLIPGINKFETDEVILLRIKELKEKGFLMQEDLKNSIKEFSLKKGIKNINELKLTAFINELFLLQKKQLFNKKFFLDKLVIEVFDNRIYSMNYLILQFKEQLITKNMMENFVGKLIEGCPKEEILCFFKIPDFQNQKEFIKHLCEMHELNNNIFSLQQIFAKEVRNNRIDWNYANEKIIFNLKF